jgi:uncharacterized membrane protein YagU involved in acid resistance
MPTTISERLHSLHLTVPGSHISAKAVLWAGFVGGVVVLVLEMILAPLVMNLGPWVPARMTAAITMGTVMLPPPDTFDLSVVLPSVVIHFALSLVYALVFAFIAKGRSMRADALLGAGFGLLLYVINFYGFTSLFPWFAEMRHWSTALGQMVYGAVLGATYAYFAKRSPRPAVH